MESEQKTYLLDAVSGKVSDDYYQKFSNDISGLSNGAINKISNVRLKSKVATILLSIFLGGLGVDRFYAGDKGGGAAKLAFNIGINVLRFIFFANTFLSIVLLIANLIFGIVVFVDIFRSYKVSLSENESRLREAVFKAKEKDGEKKNIFAKLPSVNGDTSTQSVESVDENSFDEKDGADDDADDDADDVKRNTKADNVFAGCFLAFSILIVIFMLFNFIHAEQRWGELVEKSQSQGIISFLFTDGNSILNQIKYLFNGGMSNISDKSDAIALVTKYVELAIIIEPLCVVLFGSIVSIVKMIVSVVNKDMVKCRKSVCWFLAAFYCVYFMFSTLIGYSGKEFGYDYWSGYRLSTPITVFVIILLALLLIQPFATFYTYIKNDEKSVTASARLNFVRNALNVLVMGVGYSIIFLTINFNGIFNLIVEKSMLELTSGDRAFNYVNVLYIALNFIIVAVHCSYRWRGEKLYEYLKNYVEFDKKDNNKYYAQFPVRVTIQLICACILTFAKFEYNWSFVVFPQLIIVLVLNVAMIFVNILFNKKIERLNDSSSKSDSNQNAETENQITES